MSRSTLLASALFLALAAPAFSDPIVVRSQVVRYDGYAINYVDNADHLVNRIQRAARNVCEDSTARGVDVTSAERADVRECRADAEERAVADVDNPTVSARYYRHRPRVIIDDTYSYAPESQTQSGY